MESEPCVIAELAKDLLDINDDIFSEKWFDRYDPADEAFCLKIIETAYHSACCDDFAAVCHELTGDQPYAIRYGHMHHTVCSTSDEDGQLYDVTGFVTMDELRRRYRLPKDTEIYATDGWHSDEDEKEIILRAIRYLKSIGRAPFNVMNV